MPRRGAPGGAVAAVANYADGSVALVALDAEGMPGDDPIVHRFSGSGPNKERQEGPHAHFVWFAGDELYVVDLGSDTVHRLDLAGNLLGAITFTPGSGPRHVAAGRPGSGWWRSSLMPRCAASGRSGTAPGHRSVKLKRAESEGLNYPSHIACSADGSLVYVANRGPNTIAVFSVDEAGELTRVAEVACKEPGRAISRCTMAGSMWPTRTATPLSASASTRRACLASRKCC